MTCSIKCRMKLLIQTQTSTAGLVSNETISVSIIPNLAVLKWVPPLLRLTIYFNSSKLSGCLNSLQCSSKNSNNTTIRRKRRQLKSTRSLTLSSSSRSHNGCVAHQGILSTLAPFDPWRSGLPFPKYNLTLKIQGQRSRSKLPLSAQHQVDSFP